MGERGCWPSLAARSGRGGTIGRATGCPARVRWPGGGVPACWGTLETGDATGDIGGRGAGAIGVPGRTPIGAAGRGAPGLNDAPACALVTGNGWRGPERTWPGRGAPVVVGIGRGGGGVGRPGVTLECPTGGGSVDGGRGTSGAAGSGALGAPTGGCIGAPLLRIGGRKGITRGLLSSSGFSSGGAAGAGVSIGASAFASSAEAAGAVAG